MKRLLTGILLAFCAIAARAQTTQIIANHVAYFGGVSVTGTMCLTPTNQAGQPINIVTPLGQQVSPQVPLCFPITSGVLASNAIVPDTSQTQPVNACYSAVINNYFGTQVAVFPCIQPSGSTWSFDAYVPSSLPSIPALSLPQYQVNGTPLSNQSVLNFAGSGVSTAGNTITFGGGAPSGSASNGLTGSYPAPGLNSSSVSAALNGASITPAIVNRHIEVNGVSGGGIGQAQVAWDTVSTYNQCQAVSNGGLNYIAVTGVSANQVPAAISSFWYPVPNANTPTQYDCAVYVAANKTVLSSPNESWDLQLGQGQYSSCIGTQFPSTGVQSGNPTVNIHGTGRNSSSILQTCAISQAMWYMPDSPNTNLPTLDWEGLTLNANQLAPAVLNLYGAQQSTIKDIYFLNPSIPTDHEVEIGDPSLSSHGWVYELALQDVVAGAQGFGGARGFTGTCTVTSGVPTCTVTNGGQFYGAPGTATAAVPYLAGSGSNGLTCSTPGTASVTISGGVIQTFTTTATGCPASVNPVVFGGLAISYGFKFSHLTDSHFVRDIVTGVGSVDGIFINNVSSANKFYDEHPISTFNGIEDQGNNSHYGAQLDSVFNHGWQMTGQSNTLNIYSPLHEYGGNTNGPVPGAVDYYLANVANSPVNSPKEINVFGEECGSAPGASYAHIRVPGGIIGNTTATLPQFFHIYGGVYCDAPNATTSINNDAIFQQLTWSNGQYSSTTGVGNAYTWATGVGTTTELALYGAPLAAGAAQGVFTLALKNTTPATSGQNYNSPKQGWRGTYWDGTRTQDDFWNIQNILGTGSNPTSTLTWTHTGSSGAASMALPNPTTATTGTVGENDTNVATNAQVVASAAANGQGTGSGAQPNLGISLSPYCPSGNTGNCYQTPANTQQVVDCAWTSGSPTVTCASNHFVTGDTGKRAFGYKTCNAFQNFANASGSITDSTALTITYVSATSVTLSGNAANTQTTQTGCFIWGSPDDTGAAAIDTLLAAGTSTLPYCPRILLAGGNYMFTTPHFFTNPAACLQAGSTYQGSLGNIFYHAGLEVEGRGSGVSIIYVTPGFPETGACTKGNSANACFYVPLEGRWSDFQITGGWNPSPPNIPSGTVLIAEQGPASIERFNCINWGGSDTGTFGILATSWAQLQQVDNSGCGAIGIKLGTSGQQMEVTAFRLHIENSTTGAALIAGKLSAARNAFSCYECAFSMGLAGSGAEILVNNTGGASVYLNNTIIENSGVAGSSTHGYRSQTTNTSSLILEDSEINMTGTGQSDVVCTNLCNIYARNTTFIAPTAWYADAAGDVFQDQGGNTFSGGGVFTLAGAYIGEANSAGPAAAVTTSFVLSSGFGSTAAVTAPIGGAFPVQFTATNSGTGQAASPTITYTFPRVLAVAPFSCTATQTGGTNAIGTFTSSVPTTTGVVFTYSLTPTASSTEIVQVSCVTP